MLGVFSPGVGVTQPGCGGPWHLCWGGEGASRWVPRCLPFSSHHSLSVRPSQTLFLATVVLYHLAWNVLNVCALACVFVLNCNQLVNTQPCVCVPSYPSSLVFPLPAAPLLWQFNSWGSRWVWPAWSCFLRNLGRVVFSEKSMGLPWWASG